MRIVRARGGARTRRARRSHLEGGRPEPGVAQRVLRLPPIPRGPLPGYLLIADRNNDRAIIVSPAKKIVWERDGLRGPDDTFFTPGYRGVITNEEFNDTLTEVSLKAKTAIWRYGHDGVPGLEPRLPEHAGRRVPVAKRRHDRRRHQELPHRRAHAREAGPAHPRRLVRARPSARVREPERRHAAPRRRPPRHGDRRLDRPARAGRAARLVDSLPGRVSVRCAAAPERARPRRRLHRSRQDRRGDAVRARRRGRSGARAGPIGSTGPRSRFACRTA